MFHLLTAAYILTIIPNFASSDYSNYDHVINVDPIYGNDSEQCIQGNEPCRTLGWSFNVKYRRNSTLYFLRGETHILNGQTDVFEELSDLAIIGNTSKERGVVINCIVENSGLAFRKVTDIHFESITFFNCSAQRYSTSGKYELEGERYRMYKTRVALYFYLCSNVEMARVNVSHSPNATGVIMYNTDGINMFENSTFEHNQLSTGETEIPGGGGFYVEFTFCIPNSDVHSCLYRNYSDMPDEITQHNNDATYSFDKCTFSQNIANNSDETNYIIPLKQSHVAFGRGGGLSIMLKGNATGNGFYVSNCVFQDNQAVWGAGMLISFLDVSLNNSLVVTDSVFQNNSCHPKHHHTSHGTGGGGIRIGHNILQTQKFDSSGNRVYISHSNFTGNAALSGGGLSMSPSLQLYKNHSQIVRVNITHCVFRNNMAKVGAAIEVTRFPIVVRGGEPNIYISDCKFVHNTVLVDRFLGNKTATETGVGTVYSNQVILRFRGEILFKRNNGSALAIVGRRVSFENCIVHFIHNRGRSGGAINLLGVTYILVDDNTQLVFVNNSAEVFGGAISNTYIERENLVSNPNCFIRHHNSLRNPKDWKARFCFEDNRSRMSSNDTIHTTSKYPCSWPGWKGISADNNIMCGKNWIYYRDNKSVNCESEIKTDTGSIKLIENATIISKPLVNKAHSNLHIARESEDQQKNFHPKSSLAKAQPLLRVAPGRAFKLPLRILDDFEHDKGNTTVFAARVVNFTIAEVDPRFVYTSGGFLKLNGISNNTVELHLDTISQRTWHVELKVELLDCPPGFVLSDNPPKPSSTCRCNPDSYQRRLFCHQSNFRAYLRNGYWMGMTPESNGSLVVSLCLPGYCKINKFSNFIKLPLNINELCNKRVGILCGECMPHLGLAVNTHNFRCVPCSDSNNAVHTIYYVLAVYVPLLALFTGIILFNVRLTNGPANAFIFYSQIISSTFDLTGDGHIPLNVISNSTNALLRAYRIPYGISNLDFLENFIQPLCLGTSLNALDALQLDYVIACSPLIMILVVLLALKVKSCFKSLCFSILRLQHRQLHQEYVSETASSHTDAHHSRAPSHAHKCSCKFIQNWQAGESLLHAFSAFLLLSYTKFALTSSYILNLHPILSANGTQIGPRRVYYAGQFTEYDSMYIWRYYVPSCFIIVIIGVIPLMLLGYPIIWLEKCIYKIEWLWHLYPVTKIHVLMDTFQGCFRDDRRFFAAMYFLFRLSINVGYIVTNTWLEQFVVQQIACTVFIIIFVLCWPYREEKWIFNYVDFLMLVNLAVVNALSLYLFAFSQTNHGLPLPKSAFVFQYVLVFLPLIYMILYVIWYMLKPSQKEKICKVLTKIGGSVKGKRNSRVRRVMHQNTIIPISTNPNSLAVTTSTYKLSNNTLYCDTVRPTIVTTEDLEFIEEENSSYSDEEDAMLARARCRNRYKPPKINIKSKDKNKQTTYIKRVLEQSHNHLGGGNFECSVNLEGDVELSGCDRSKVSNQETLSSIAQKLSNEVLTKRSSGYASQCTKDSEEEHVDIQTGDSSAHRESRGRDSKHSSSSLHLESKDYGTVDRVNTLIKQLGH